MAEKKIKATVSTKNRDTRFERFEWSDFNEISCNYMYKYDTAST